MSFRFTENRPRLKVGDALELRVVDYDGEVLWLESRVREVVTKDWKPKSFEQLFQEALEEEQGKHRPATSYADYLQCDSDGYVVSAPWTMDGMKFVERRDEGKTWRRARGALKVIPCKGA